MEPSPDDQKVWIQSVFSNRSGSAVHAQQQALNWLFAVLGAGIAGSLTVVSGESASCLSLVALVLFTAGLVTLMIYAVAMFYEQKKHYHALRSDLGDFGAGRCTFTELLQRENARPSEYKPGEILAWISGGFALVALLFLIVSVVD